MTAAPPAVERLPDLFQGVSYSVLVFLRHLRFWSKAHGEVLRYSTLRQQLRHEDEPLIAGIVLIVLPAAGGNGTIIFTAVGLTVMAAAGIIIFMSRKKKDR